MNIKLDSKTLLEDNAQLWHYGLRVKNQPNSYQLGYSLEYKIRRVNFIIVIF